MDTTLEWEGVLKPDVFLMVFCKDYVRSFVVHIAQGNAEVDRKPPRYAEDWSLLHALQTGIENFRAGKHYDESTPLSTQRDTHVSSGVCRYLEEWLRSSNFFYATRTIEGFLQIELRGHKQFREVRFRRECKGSGFFSEIVGGEYAWRVDRYTKTGTGADLWLAAEAAFAAPEIPWIQP